jgi:hypothetical protein
MYKKQQKGETVAIIIWCCVLAWVPEGNLPNITTLTPSGYP